nr:scavenger mRNA decapping enzyme DcpS [Hymenolepis microstoma]
MSSSDLSQEQMNNSSILTTSISAPPPLKRHRTSESSSPKVDLATYSPSNTQILRVLRNDTRNKMICLHVKFKDSLDEDGIIILQKSSFPSEVSALCAAKIGTSYDERKPEMVTGNQVDFPEWKVEEVVNNDVYHRSSVMAGLESVNKVSMTVIHPAAPQHFAKYSSSKRQIVHETPKVYQSVILPFLESNPKDLCWVENILNGTAEVERVLFTDEDASLGFTLVLDYRWDGKHLNELHALALARDPGLMCLRDLRACHLPMLKKMLADGRKKLVEKYRDEEGRGECLREDQIIAYFHYPPTFYRLHMHFVHVEGSADGGTQVGKAYLAEDVIFNIGLKSEYYAERTIPIYLHDTHPFFMAIREAEQR